MLCFCTSENSKIAVRMFGYLIDIVPDAFLCLSISLFDYLFRSNAILVVSRSVVNEPKVEQYRFALNIIVNGIFVFMCDG